MNDANVQKTSEKQIIVITFGEGMRQADRHDLSGGIRRAVLFTFQ